MLLKYVERILNLKLGKKRLVSGDQEGRNINVTKYHFDSRGDYFPSYLLNCATYYEPMMMCLEKRFNEKLSINSYYFYF